MHSLFPHALTNHNVSVMSWITNAIVLRCQTLVQISAWVPAILNGNFRDFSQFLQEKFRYSTANYVRSASLQIISDALFSNYMNY